MLLVMRVLSIVPLNFKASELTWSSILGFLQFFSSLLSLAATMVGSVIARTLGVQFLCTVAHSCTSHTS